MNEMPLVEVANRLRIERDTAVDQLERERAENRGLQAEVKRLKAKVQSDVPVGGDRGYPGEPLMTLENQDLRERIKEEVAFLRSQLDAVHQVLIERGLDEGPHAGLLPQRVERAIVGLVAERDEARGEAAHLRAELSGLEDHFNRVTAERTRYRLALEAIAESDFAWFARIKARETLGLATPGEGGGAR